MTLTLVGKKDKAHEPGSCFVRPYGHHKDVHHCGDDRCLAAIPEAWRPSKQKRPDTSRPGLHVWRDEQYGDLFMVHTFECPNCSGYGGFGGQGVEMDVECDECTGGVIEDEFCRCATCKAIVKADDVRELLEAAIKESAEGTSNERTLELTALLSDGVTT